MSTFVPDVALVQASWLYLRAQRIHPTFAGYLCVRWTARNEGRDTELRPDFRRFFDEFLRVPDATPNRPYAFPFNESGESDTNRWFNTNVAGSYAPSSLRDISPFRKCVGVVGSRKLATYSLLPNHAISARDHLLFKTRIRALELGAFFYRDYSFAASTPRLQSITDVFRDAFGLRADVTREDSDFKELFDPRLDGWSDQAMLAWNGGAT